MLRWKQFVKSITFTNCHMSRPAKYNWWWLFSKLKFNYVERSRIKICNSSLIWPTKLLDRSKAVSKMTQIKISCKQCTRSWTPGLLWKKKQSKVPQDLDARRSMTRKKMKMATTSKLVITGMSKVMKTMPRIVTMTTRIA